MLFELKMFCPDCGGTVWHDMQSLASNEFCCDYCGSVYSTEEMEWMLVDAERT